MRNKISGEFRFFTTLILVVSTAFLAPGNWFFLCNNILLAIIWIFFMETPVKKLGKRLLPQIIFICIFVVPLGWNGGIFLFLRSTVSLFLVNSFLLSIPKNSLGTILGSLPFSGPLKENLILTVHYLQILSEDVSKMRESASLRGVRSYTKWLRNLSASLVGSLYIRAMYRAERLNHAMALRGYSGNLTSNHTLSPVEKLALRGILLFMVSIMVLSYIYYPGIQ